MYYGEIRSYTERISHVYGRIRHRIRSFTTVYGVRNHRPGLLEAQMVKFMVNRHEDCIDISNELLKLSVVG